MASAALGDESTAMGGFARAVGSSTLGGGFANVDTTAIGANAQAGAGGVGQSFATAVGEGALANAENASAFGQGAVAADVSSVALG